MMKSLFLAVAVASLSLAGCADDAAETDTVIVEPTAPVVTEPMDDMMMDDTTGMMSDDAMMADTTGMMMEDDAMMADSTNM